jgi:ribonuclease T1
VSPRPGALAAIACLAILALPGCLGGEEEPAATSVDAKGQGAAETISEQEFVAVSRTLAAIESGQPLPYEEDGATFHNREGLLPERPDGYYREYTVETPGSEDRGARRLVIGRGGETYYTRDHYQSFIGVQSQTFSDKLPE